MPLPNDLVPVGPVTTPSASTLPPDLISVSPATATPTDQGLPTDLVPVKPESYPLGNPLGEQAPDQTDWKQKIALAVERANTDPIGAMADSVAVFAQKAGLSDATAQNAGRFVHSLMDSLGPLGQEFAASGEAAKMLQGGSKTTEGVPAAGKVAADNAPADVGVTSAVKLPEDLIPVENAAKPLETPAINLDRISAPDDVKAALDEAATSQDQFTNARRGVRTWQMTTDDAYKLLGDPEGLNKVLARKPGDALNAEKITAMRTLLLDQEARVRATARIAGDVNATAAQKADLLAQASKFNGIFSQLTGARAEAGRSLNIFNKMAEASATGKNLSDLIDQATATGKLDALIEGINKLDNAAPGTIGQFVQRSLAARTIDKIQEFWINGLLSGLKTHAANILSNTLVAAWTLPEHALATTISKVTGSGMSLREIPARAFGSLEGMAEGIMAAGRALKTEEPSFGLSKMSAEMHPKAIGGVFGRIVRAPGTALMAEDEAFKWIAYRQEINTLAARQAANEGLKGKDFFRRALELRSNPSLEMQKAAHDFAHEQTFTNKPGQITSDIIKWSNKWPVLKIVTPFVRTPVNIVKYAQRRSGFAIFSKGMRDDLLGRNGGIARDQAIAKVTLGSAVSAATVYFVKKGLITGQGPTDPNERAMNYLKQIPPYSVKIGDTYYSYSRLEPLATLVGVAADYAELSQHMNENDKNTIASLILGSVTKNLTNKTFLSGVAELMQASSNPDQYGAKYIENLAGTLVPSGVAQYAQTKDPYLRQARTVLDKIRSRVPGYREELPFKRNLFGEPIKLQGSLGPDIASPIYESKVRHDPAIDELTRLNLAPTLPERKIMGTELTSDQYDRLQYLTGTALHTVLNAVVGMPGWDQIPDHVKTEFLNKQISRVRKAARDALIREQPDIVNSIVNQKLKQLH